jgi:Fe-S-cluster containining protein
MSEATRTTSVPVALDDTLPLTCTRAGTCCHGKLVWVNPWELARLAATLGQPVAELIAARTDDGGIRLRFDGAPGWRGQRACTFYDPARGCIAHAGRPLPCRLYPLGRERRGERRRYAFDGPQFPCTAGCAEVDSLPRLTVRDYLAGQDVGEGEAVSDAYLELAQDLAEGAFVIAIDSGLAARGHPLLTRWRAEIGRGGAERAAALPAWLRELLLAPPLDAGDGRAFVAAHASLLQERAQAEFAALREPEALADGSCAMLGAALHLARSLNADTAVMAERWLITARANGMR